MSTKLWLTILDKPVNCIKQKGFLYISKSFTKKPCSKIHVSYKKWETVFNNNDLFVLV